MSIECLNSKFLNLWYKLGGLVYLWINRWTKCKHQTPPSELNVLLPQNINRILHSLTDAGIVLNVMLYVWILSADKKKIFTSCSWHELMTLTIYLALDLTLSYSIGMGDRYISKLNFLG